MKQVSPLIVLCLLGNFAVASENSVSIPVTAAHERIVVALWEGDINVMPGPAGTFAITSNCEPREPQQEDQMEGFRSLRSSAALPEIVPSDRTISVRTYERGPRCTVALTVPVGLNLNTRVNFSGAIQVNEWRGRLVAWSADGDVSINSHSGSLSVTAMNGDATVSIADGGIDADSAITAANGTLSLTVNPDSVPAIRAQARWGDVKTNLDLPFEEIVEEGGTWFAIEGADAEPKLTMRNLNRDIVIRSSTQ